MRPEKQNLTKEYLARLNASPFFIVVNYKGMKVSQLTELRKRLSKAGAEMHVVKNSVFRFAAKEAGVIDDQEKRRGVQPRKVIRRDEFLFSAHVSTKVGG